MRREAVPPTETPRTTSSSSFLWRHAGQHAFLAFEDRARRFPPNQQLTASAAGRGWETAITQCQLSGGREGRRLLEDA